MTATTAQHMAMEILSKIAAVIVTLLLYGVITILQMPKTAHAAGAWDVGLDPGGHMPKVTSSDTTSANNASSSTA